MVVWRVRRPERELRGDEKKRWAQVRQTLWDYEPLRASHAEILIDVQGRAVRLSGRVRTLSQKVIAGLLVQRLPEVQSVANELLADAEVVRAVADALARDERTAPYVIQVEARHGVVMLRGEVASEGIRQAAVEAASRTPSVAAVHDRLSIGGPTYKPYAVRPGRPAAMGSDGPGTSAQAAAELARA
ncbi:MAG TPA: BON domain-containing protein [Chloroflexota bacterium]|nr:BON domain-containing protein [Chloroflexota bacterium]